MKPKLKPPRTKRLKLNCGIMLSNLAFKLNLRRHNKVVHRVLQDGRGLHSCTYRLTVSTFCGISCVCGRGQRQETAQVELKRWTSVRPCKMPAFESARGTILAHWAGAYTRPLLSST